MIVASNQPLPVGVVFMPGKLILENNTIPSQPMMILRQATAAEYCAECPANARTKPDVLKWFWFYEISTD